MNAFTIQELQQLHAWLLTLPLPLQQSLPLVQKIERQMLELQRPTVVPQEETNK